MIKECCAYKALWNYLRFSEESYSMVKNDWKNIRDWISKYGYRFKKESSELLELWEWGEDS